MRKPWSVLSALLALAVFAAACEGPTDRKSVV